MTWKRIIGWVLAAMAALVLVVAVGGLLFLKSNHFENYALRKISEQAYASTGGRTEIRGLDFSLSGLTAHLYNITVHGTEEPNQPPLLQVDKLTVGVKIESALHQKIALRELLIERPVVHLATNRAGRNNLPPAPPSPSQSHASIFDLGIGHFQLSNGEINYNDKKMPLEADIYNLGTDVRFDPSEKRYSGTLSYTDGRMHYGDYGTLAHNFNAKFNATPDRVTLESLALRVGASELLVHAAMSGYSNPVADADYEVRIHAQDFASLSPSARPSGDVLLSGKLRYQSSAQQPLLQSISTTGQVACEVLRAAPSGSTVELRKLKGRYQLANGNFRMRDLSLETLGGAIKSDVEMQHLEATPSSRIRASFDGISLRAAQQALHRSELKGASVSGALNGTAEASWKGDISHVRARADVTVRAAASRPSNPSGGEIPVDGVIHAAYDGSRQSLQLRDTALRIPSASLSAQGEVSNHSNLQVQISATDLHQLAALAASVGRTPPAPVSGSGLLNATVRGSTRRPEIAGQLSAQHLEVQGTGWSTAKLNVRASPSQLTIQNGILVNAHQGQASFDAAVGLENWSYQPANPIRANLSVQRMPVGDLQRLANQHYPLSGELSAKVSIEGSQLNPTGSGSAEIVNAHAYEEAIQTLALKFNAANGSIVSALNLAAPAGTLKANVSYTPKTKAYTARLDAPAIVLQKLRTLQARNSELTGTVTASVSGEGTLDQPRLTAVVQLPKLELGQKSIGAFKAEVRVADQRADLNLDSNVAEATVKARGRVDLSGAYYTEAAIDTGAIPLDRLVATTGQSSPQAFQGQTEFHATIQGPLRDPSQLEAHLSIPTLKANYQSLQIGITRPIRADYSNSVVTLQPAEIQGTGTSLRFEGRMPLAGNGSPNLTAQGSIDVRVLRIFVPDVETSGTLALDVRASGTAQNPNVQGQMRVENVYFAANQQAPIAVEKVNGTLDITSDRVQISNLTGQMGGGQVEIGGSIRYRPSPQFNIAVKGQSIRLRYPEGLRALFDTNLAFSGTTEASTLNGRVLIDSLKFSPEFDLAKFADQFSTETATPTQPGFADTVKLGVSVQSKQGLNATSSQVSLGGTANLQVIGTAANPVITGRTNLSSGELFFRNVRYQLQRGVITFDDPNQTNPVMNVSVTTKVEQYNLTLTLRGPVDKLTVSYVSDPPLATADIINLIARGQTTQEANASSQSTDSLLASGAASQLSSSVQKLAGISSLQIDPLIGGNNQNPSARVALQQRVSNKLLFTFSTDVSQPGNEVVQGEYQINKRWSASVARDQLGGVSVDGKFHTRF
jgi:translocation and assembly module TamB